MFWRLIDEKACVLQENVKFISFFTQIFKRNRPQKLRGRLESYFPFTPESTLLHKHRWDVWNWWGTRGLRYSELQTKHYIRQCTPSTMSERLEVDGFHNQYARFPLENKNTLTATLEHEMWYQYPFCFHRTVSKVARKTIIITHLGYEEKLHEYHRPNNE